MPPLLVGRAHGQVRPRLPLLPLTAESGPDIGDLSIFDNQAVAQLYDRNAFKADAPSLRFWKS